MTPERRKLLERGEGCLLIEEWRQGWHFCQDFDLDLVNEPDETGTCRWCGFDPKSMLYDSERQAKERENG